MALDQLHVVIPYRSMVSGMTGSRAFEPLSPMIVVDHPVALADQDVVIELCGFPQHELVTVTATMEGGSKWQARAAYLTDDDGKVSIAHRSPVSGSYSDVSAMGLFWSAERLPGDLKPRPEDWMHTPFHVRLEADGQGGARAELTLERRLLGPGVSRQAVHTNGMVGSLFLPPGEGPHPAVMVVSGGWGGLDEYRGALLASHGYAAFTLAYFAMQGLPQGLFNIPLEYFENAIRWMRLQPWLGDRLLAVWGSSRGGELALLLGATFPDINAVSAWVPSGVLFWAIGGDGPAWTYRGKPLPYLQQDNPFAQTTAEVEPGKPIAYAPIYRSHLADTRAVERASIAVENICGPVQLVSGGDDQMWPSAELADIAYRRLQAHRHPYPFRHLRFEKVGHHILVPHGPRTVLVDSFEGYVFSQGGTPRDNADAGVEAWRDLLKFLEDAVRLRGR
jgi:dienelactone hydrolase